MWPFSLYLKYLPSFLSFSYSSRVVCVQGFGLLPLLEEVIFSFLLDPPSMPGFESSWPCLPLEVLPLRLLLLWFGFKPAVGGFMLLSTFLA
jgi:hypothetical protein